MPALQLHFCGFFLRRAGQGREEQRTKGIPWYFLRNFRKRCVFGFFSSRFTKNEIIKLEKKGFTSSDYLEKLSALNIYIKRDNGYTRYLQTVMLTLKTKTKKTLYDQPKWRIRRNERICNTQILSKTAISVANREFSKQK